MKKNLLLILGMCYFITIAQTPCINGFATVGGKSYPCNGLTLQSYISSSTMGAKESQDSWGWTDPQSGKEYAIIALDNGTAFVDISNPTSPKYLARLNTHVGSSLWRDVKVYKNHAFIVSDANGNHGMQIFDLRRLRTLSGNPAITFTKTQTDGNLFWDGSGSNRKGSAHNIVINEASGYAYILGSPGFNSGGPIVVKLDNNNNGIPNDPVIVKLYPSQGYCHDAEVVIYDGPDPNYQGREIMVGAFSGNNKVNIIDFTDKTNPVVISSITYSNKYYTHQGWFTEDKKFFIAGDEVDEENIGFNTRTLVFNVEDLDNPYLAYTHYGATAAIDHNGYVRGNRYYLANYAAGLRIMKVDGLYNQNPSMAEINYFDCYPTNNSAAFNGTWNVYPFFESGNIIATGFGNGNIDGDGGLFVIKDPNYDNTPPNASCQNYTATLDKNTGSVTITAANIDNGSNDNFGITKRTITAGQTTFTCKDVGQTFNVTLTVEDDYANKASCTATVTVVAPTTRYISGAWNNGTPGPGSNARISQNYNTATKGNIDACSCEIDANRTLTVAAEDYLSVTKNIAVNGNLIVEHQGSVVQTYNTAQVSNNGVINVNYTTPYMVPRVFIVAGSPMTTETRDGAFGNSYMFLNHLTENFLPNPDVAAQFPSAENFADDNYDNWTSYTGSINPGEGYIARPQLNGNDGNKTYDMTFELGTLNTGNIDFNVIYNGNRNSSPNVLANPYASAISAVDFINANSMVDEVYFWNPNTPPSPLLPGAYTMNFSMEDISMYNLLGGTPAPSDPTQTEPSGYISTGQGFGIKATAAGVAAFSNSMRVTGNNNTATRPMVDGNNRIWIQVKNEQYQMQNNTLIGFSQLATSGMDQGYDSRRLATVLSLYTHFEDGSKELGIQSRETFQDGAKVLMGFSSLLDENLEYAISIKDMQGPAFSDVTVFLVDNELDITTNLSQQNYIFKVGKGTYNNRFTVLFRSNEILGDVATALDKVAIFPNPANNFLNIVSPEAHLSGVEIYDLSGRRLKHLNISNNSNFRVDISTLQSAIYFVKISTDFGSVTKQIIKQ
ncbi:choice-of-anchor B family protein [Aequorivita sp. SDUM287046]|uniref:Choice-of-anchor B family protein n=1 Tax=Aequorivita aurantiaca TaxID=3053356 RepID=A0ABT8DLA8_9FLAO|nr:choice-of-anchor B family protein [Aequorivita aurantiaca]MDN3724746.1 choice-of-anchor B family protein [Aequorivita aurantiaca]